MTDILIILISFSLGFFVMPYILKKQCRISPPIEKPETKAGKPPRKRKGFYCILTGYIRGLFLPDEISLSGLPANLYPSCCTAKRNKSLSRLLLIFHPARLLVIKLSRLCALNGYCQFGAILFIANRVEITTL